MLCGRFCGVFSRRKGMRLMSPPMPFVVWRDFARERQPLWSSIYLVRVPGCDLCKKIANLIPGLPLVILSGARMLRTRSFCWKWVLTIT